MVESVFRGASVSVLELMLNLFHERQFSGQLFSPLYGVKLSGAWSSMAMSGRCSGSERDRR